MSRYLIGLSPQQVLSELEMMFDSSNSWIHWRDSESLFVSNYLTHCTLTWHNVENKSMSALLKNVHPIDCSLALVQTAMFPCASCSYCLLLKQPHCTVLKSHMTTTTCQQQPPTFIVTALLLHCAVTSEPSFYDKAQCLLVVSEETNRLLSKNPNVYHQMSSPS